MNLSAIALLMAASFTGVAASLNVSAAMRPAPGEALRARLAEGVDVIGIVHWGLNTYTDREWGYGDEDPQMLNPSGFDADQIVLACKAGGLKGLVVVAKHHDGFCLWPTKTTSHNIRKSPFRGGKGNYLKEMERACRRAGLKFGVYVSPWDRNSAHYGTEKYVEIFHSQIKELLGGDYGEVFEMWFDGANGGDGWYGGAKERRKIGVAGKYYRLDEVFRFVRGLQPGVTIFAGEKDESDFRWPGNERGILDPDSRATTVAAVGYAEGKYLNPAYKPQINKGTKNGTHFRMCEADFPLRKGWFYHEREKGTTKKAAYLTQRFIGTVGNGGIMNIGIAPDKAGVLDEDDVRELRGFGEMCRNLFANEVTEDGKPFNIVEMREDLANGEQIDGWRILADGSEVLSGESIGYRRIRLLDKAISPKRIELQITAHGGAPRPVSMRRYYVDQNLAATILAASGDCGETDTAKWMGGGAKTGAVRRPALEASGDFGIDRALQRLAAVAPADWREVAERNRVTGLEKLNGADLRIALAGIADKYADPATQSIGNVPLSEMGEIAEAAFRGKIHTDGFGWALLKSFVMSNVKVDDPVVAAKLLVGFDRGLAGVSPVRGKGERISFSPRWIITPFRSGKYRTTLPGGGFFESEWTNNMGSCKYNLRTSAKKIDCCIKGITGVPIYSVHVNGRDVDFKGHSFLAETDGNGVADILVTYSWTGRVRQKKGVSK